MYSANYVVAKYSPSFATFVKWDYVQFFNKSQPINCKQNMKNPWFGQ